MRYILITTSTCPKCPVVKEYMEEVEVEGEDVNASEPEGLEIAKKYGVTAVPTVIFLEGDEEVGRFYAKEEIEEFLAGK